MSRILWSGVHAPVSYVDINLATGIADVAARCCRSLGLSSPPTRP